MANIPEHFLDILQSKSLAHVATIGPKGEPQNNPVWFHWDGSHIRFSLSKARQKYRNLLREPRIALSIVDPANPYRYIEIRGAVARIDEDRDFRFSNSMSQKYLSRDVSPDEREPGEERVIVVVKPQRVTLFPPQKETKQS